MATEYPVTFNVQRPERFDRTQALIRIVVLIVLSVLAGAVGWIFGIFYLAVPVLAAVFVSQDGPEKYLQDDRLPNILRWYLAVYCYLFALTDKFPTDEPQNYITFQVRPSGSPTVGSALLRLIYSIPSAIVLAIVAIVGVVIWIIAMVSILVQETYSEGLYNFQLGIMRWHARLLGYHASLVDRYPPFAVDTGPEPTEPGSAAPAPTA